MLEWYEAYSDAEYQKQFVQKILRDVTKHVRGKTSVTYGGNTIDLESAFNEVAYFDLFRDHLDLDPSTASHDEIFAKAKEVGARVSDSDGIEKMLDSIYKKQIRPELVQPTIIHDYPADYLPLAKAKPDDPEMVSAFQVVIGGIEIVKAFSELNDPLAQRERLEEQERQKAAGDAEAQSLDEDFLEALEYGMPPAGGVGIGIDRLIMVLTDTHHIRDVIFFPTLKPKSE